jgi:alpha-galactosidase/6-phospho-beta-glucosidase family protein
MPAKIVIIGGGSYNWAPTIINDILLTPSLNGSKIVLEDIAPEPLEVIGALGRKMIADKKSDCMIHTTTDESEALENADFVIVTISTGGFETMAKDLEIPARFGVHQTVGDTVGPGGLARALRSIPVMVGIARHMEKQCPQAWLINYTNPMSVLCLAVNQTTGIQTIGLCHELQGVLYILKSMLNLNERDKLEYEVAGVNHFIWLLKLQINGRDGFEMLRQWMEHPTAFTVQDQDVKEMFAPSTIDRAKLKLELFKRYGYLPAAGDRHIIEFLVGYLNDVAQAEVKYGIKPTSIQERGESWFGAMRAYVHGMLEENFPLPKEKSSEAITEILAALAGGIEPIVDIVNLPNAGQVGNLPKGCIVETLAKISKNAVKPLAPLTLPGPIREMILPHAENQFLTVKAALEGDRLAALEVLRRDPLSRNAIDIEKMLDELLQAHCRYLPQFK